MKIDLRLLRREPTADATVPPSGATGYLTGAAATAMAFLAVCALALALAANRTAERWSVLLAGSATLELSGPTATEDARRAVTILRQTEGIASAEALTPEATAGLLEPWIGEAELLEALDLPVLIAVEETPTLDRAALDNRLKGELPGALYHRHTDWRARIEDATTQIRGLATAVLAIALTVMGIVVTIAARASLAMHVRVIETLRLLGATDAYIARAFVRRMTLRTLSGALVGTAVGIALVLALDFGGGPQGAGTLRPTGAAGWIALLAIPPAAAVIAFAATRAAAFRVLARIR